MSESRTPTFPPDSVCRDLGYIRQWIEGFRAAGKPGPAHADALRKAQILIKELAATQPKGDA